MKIELLCYINRSGSTFLSQQLSKFKEVLVCPEADILANLLLVNPQKAISDKGILKKIQSDVKFSQWNLDLNSLPDNYKTNFELFHSILENYRNQERLTAEIVVFKAERMFQLVKGLKLHKELTANVEFIYLVRDVRAVYNSQLQTLNPQTGKPFNFEPVNCALFWNSFVKTITNKKNALDTCIFYENLVAEFPKSIFSLVNKLGLKKEEFDFAKGDIYARLPENHKDIHKNIKSLPQVDRIDDWKKKLYNKERRILEIASEKKLKTLGYTVNKKGIKYLKLYLVFLSKAIRYYFKRLIERVLFRIRKVTHD